MVMEVVDGEGRMALRERLDVLRERERARADAGKQEQRPGGGAQGVAFEVALPCWLGTKRVMGRL
jgi:hypothetical protein